MLWCSGNWSIESWVSRKLGCQIGGVQETGVWELCIGQEEIHMVLVTFFAGPVQRVPLSSFWVMQGWAYEALQPIWCLFKPHCPSPEK